MGKRKATQVREEEATEKSSPIPSVAAIGSGALLALVKGDVARPLVAVMVSREDVEPCGMLLCVDVMLEPEERLAGACMNAGAALVLAIWGSVAASRTGNVFMHGVLRTELLSPAFQSAWQSESVITLFPDLFLMQYRAILHAANEEIGRQPGGITARETRTDAVERLRALEDWATVAQLMRSGGVSSAPLQVPAFVVQQAIDLARLGERLSYFEREAEGLVVPNWNELTPQARTKLIKRRAREVDGGVKPVAESVAASCVPPVKPETVRRWITRQKDPADLVGEILGIQRGRT